MSTQAMDPERRKLIAATSGLGAIGCVAAATPFVISMTPSAKARAAGAPVEVDISALEPGKIMTEEWRGKPVWILHRTPEMMESLKRSDAMVSDPGSEKSTQPEYVDKRLRSIKPEILVLVGICTHLGCSPDKRIAAGAESGVSADWPGGFFCPCHGSKFDLAGRVFKNVPAPTNLVVPPYSFLSDTRIIIGVDQKG